MFDDAQPQLEKILSLVQLCPEKLQEKCFEMLLDAYLGSKVAKPIASSDSNPQAPSAPDAMANPSGAGNGNAIPEAIRTRFSSLVARTKVSTANAAALFDFNVDPFTFHALSVPGGSNREKMRSIALLLALKGYLTSTSWMADWKEFRAACLDHSCWDQNNVVTAMRHEWFKTSSAAENINLSPSGVKAADAIFAKLTGGEDNQLA
jgi:hypothetical protein